MRAALSLYPPAWRARYGDEVGALLDESGAGPAVIASVAWRALPAWISPPGYLRDRPARVRSHLATALMSWSVLVGLGLVFAQLTQLQGFVVPGHPVVRLAYAVFDVTLALSVLAAGAGALPLWLLMLRRTWRERRPREAAYLLLPVIVPAGYLIALLITVRLTSHADGISPWCFLALVLAGFAAAATAAAGPGLALRRLQPRGPALRLAAVAAGVAAGVMAVAALAIAAAITGLCLWARGFAGYHHAVLAGMYVVLVLVAATVTGISALRGTRAAFTEPAIG